MAGLSPCDVDAHGFYEQTVPLYESAYQRWVIVFASDDDATEAVVLDRLQLVIAMAGLAPSEYRALKVNVVSDQFPNDLSRAVKVVNPLPQAQDEKLYYASVEFWYAGKERTARWPWKSDGFWGCPEDVVAGVLSVLPPARVPVGPPTVFDEKVNPYLVEAGETVLDAVDAAKQLVPVQQLGGAIQLLMWGGAAVLLFNLFTATRPKSARS